MKLGIEQPLTDLQAIRIAKTCILLCLF